MKRLLAMMTIGRDVSSFFADVVKNVIVNNTEVKKLVYMYLVSYAEQKQELALLSINTFQKDLVHSSARVRANAMKVKNKNKITTLVVDVCRACLLLLLLLFCVVCVRVMMMMLWCRLALGWDGNERASVWGCIGLDRCKKEKKRNQTTLTR